MPRTRKRFGRLAERVKSLGGQQPTAGTEAAYFFDYLTGKPGAGANMVAGNKLPANARLMGRTTLVPFGIRIATAPTDNQYHIVEISAMANSAMTKVGLSQAEVGFDDTKIDVATDDPNFYPAQAVVSFERVGGSPDSNKIGGFSGRKYKYANNRSAVIPFGRGATAWADDVIERQKQIITGGTAGQILGVSFIDEKWTASGRATRLRADLPTITL